MAITFENAITIAQMELNIILQFSDRCILLPEHAIETPYGWKIPFAQRDFRTRKQVTIGGNVPFFVDRFTGAVSRVNYFVDFEVWLEAYAIKHGYKVSEPPQKPL